MNKTKTHLLRILQIGLLLSPPLLATAADIAPVPQRNGEGMSLTFSTRGTIDSNNPFFKPFGNGRACASCHQESQGWSITPTGLQARFNQSNGNDPIFKLNDGANSPNALVATLEQKRAAYSMLLSKGLIRVGLPIPAGAEFVLHKEIGRASCRERVSLVV